MVQAEHSDQTIESYDVVGMEDMRVREQTWRAEVGEFKSNVSGVVAILPPLNTRMEKSQGRL